jgi:cyclophilin family peptidyl-prolyl cis-trans isomerase
MDVVAKIAKTPTGRGGPFASDVPRDPIVIESMSLVDGN